MWVNQLKVDERLHYYSSVDEFAFVFFCLSWWVTLDFMNSLEKRLKAARRPLTMLFKRHCLNDVDRQKTIYVPLSGIQIFQCNIVRHAVAPAALYKCALQLRLHLLSLAKHRHSQTSLSFLFCGQLENMVLVVREKLLFPLGGKH